MYKNKTKMERKEQLRNIIWNMEVNSVENFITLSFTDDEIEYIKEACNHFNNRNNESWVIFENEDGEIIIEKLEFSPEEEEEEEE